MISEIFSEVIIAPDFEPEARSVLQKKKNLRLIRLVTPPTARPAVDVRSVSGGVLVQDADLAAEITERRHEKATDKHGTESAMVRVARGQTREIERDRLSRADRTLGIGAGQMSRIDSSRIAIWKAKEAGLSLKAARSPATRFSLSRTA